MIRTVIVEDAPIVRRGIRRYLQEEADVEIVGEAGDGPDAVVQIAAHRPDLVLLDVQMPGFDGFEVLERSREAPLKAVIFITAHADYAMRAFDTNAVSYLLKPIDPVRFHEVVHRARLLIAGERTAARKVAAAEPAAHRPAPAAIESADRRAAAPLSRLLVKQRESYQMLKTDEIDWIGSTGEYTTLHVGSSSYLMRVSLSELSGKLDDRQFARIHRSTIVNLDRVREVQPRSHGDCDVRLADGTLLRLSRSYRGNLWCEFSPQRLSPGSDG